MHLMKNILNNKYIIIVFILLIPGIIIPLLHSGYAGDDTLSSLVRSSLALNNESLLERYVENIKLMSPSRLGLTQVYLFLFYCIGGSLIALKIYNALLIFLLLFYFFKLIKFISGDEILALISCTTFISLIQFREYGDPILAFFGITSLSLLTVVMAIYYGLNSLEKNSQKNTVLANVTILISSQMYEYNIFILLLLFISIKIFLKLNILYIFRKFSISIVIISLYIAATLYVRSNPLTEDNSIFHSAYQVSFSVYLILKSFFVHLVTILPLSNIYINNILNANYIYYLIFASVTLPVFYFINFKKIDIPFKKLSLLIVIGLVLFVVPTLLISMSPKYQQEINFGMTYTNSLYMAAGLAITLSSIIYRYANTKFISLYVGLMFTIIILNIFVNNEVVRRLNTFWHFPRNIAVEAMKAGLFNGVQGANPVIISGVNYPWSISPFYYEYGNIKANQRFYQGAPGMLFSTKKLERSLLAGDKSEDQVAVGSYVNDFPYLSSHIKKFDGTFYHMSFDSNSNAYFFNYTSTAIDSGKAIFCRIREMVANQNDISSVLCDSFKVFIKDASLLSPPNFQMLSYPSNGKSPLMLNFSIENTVASTLTSGSFMYEHKGDNFKNFVDPNSINIDNTKLHSNVITKGPSPFDNKINLARNIINFHPIKYADNFTLEFVFSLDELKNSYQNSNAHLFGNHPGNGFQGFVCYKSLVGLNTYAIDYGDGRSWKNIGLFEIQDTNIHKIVLKIKGGMVSAYLDSNLIGASSSKYSHSLSPLLVGGMPTNSRLFRGNFYNLSIIESP